MPTPLTSLIFKIRELPYISLPIDIETSPSLFTLSLSQSMLVYPTSRSYAVSNLHSLLTCTLHPSTLLSAQLSSYLSNTLHPFLLPLPLPLIPFLAPPSFALQNTSWTSPVDATRTSIGLTTWGHWLTCKAIAGTVCSTDICVWHWFCNDASGLSRLPVMHISICVSVIISVFIPGW